jgi:hypothetical protein
MPRVTLALSDGREILCPHLLSGSDLLTLLQLPAIVLGTATPLRNGEVLRAFRRIDANVQSIDLSGYAHIFQSDKQLIGRIVI